jgi:Tfp pilus assembly protein PilX
MSIYRSNIARQKNGMILVTVLMTIIVLSLLTVSILSQNVSQSASSQGQVEQIKAQELAQGALWKAYTDMSLSGATTPTVNGEYLDGKPYSVSVDPKPASSTVPYNISVSY